MKPIDEGKNSKQNQLKKRSKTKQIEIKRMTKFDTKFYWNQMLSDEIQNKNHFKNRFKSKK